MKNFYPIISIALNDPESNIRPYTNKEINEFSSNEPKVLILEWSLSPH